MRRYKKALMCVIVAWTRALLHACTILNPRSITLSQVRTLAKTFRHDSSACAAGKGKVLLIFGAVRLACVF